MNKKYLNIHNDERGSAILLTLGILSLLLTMAMVFAVTSRNARSMALSAADGESAELAAESAADRAVSIMYYIGKEGDKPTVVDNGRETMEYNTVPYIGSNDCSNVPMLKQTELVRHTAGGNQPKQNILYLFGKEDQIRNAGGTFDAGSILHNEVNKTNLFTFFKSTGNYGSALVSGLPTNIGDEAFQFRNVLDAEDKVASRYGYMILSDGAKMDINSLVLGGGDTKVPYVKDGVFSNDAPPANIPFAEGESVSAVMGFKNDGTIETDVAEGKSIRYGVHPQEIRVADVYGDGINDTTEPAAWYNYDALIANTKNSDDKVQFGADIMRYSVTSGTDDREIRFTGAESKDDLEEGSSTLQKLLKTDISLPSGDDWEEISDDAENAPSFVADTMPEKLGFDNGEELFLDDDGNDLTAQVMSNLIDFSDEDDYATHNAEIGGGKVKMNTAIDADTVINTPENWYFGNEKVPYISGVGLELCEPAGGVTNSTVSYNILFVGNRTVDVWSIPSAAAAPNLKLKMRALLGNIFNEDFPDNVHCRVVVRGRLAIYYKVQTRNAVNMDQIVTYFADQTYTGETTTPNSLARHTTAYTTLSTKLGLGGIGGNVLGTGLYNESSENTLLQNDDAYTDFALEFNTSTGSIDALTFNHELVGEAQKIEEGKRRAVSNGLGKVISIHTRILIKDIVVMTGESDTADKLCDLAYIKPHSTDNLSAEYSYNFVSGAPAYNNAALGIGAASTYLGAHYVVKDPRFNHLNTGWKCGHPDGSGFTECKDNTGAEFGVITQSDASVTDATLNTLAANAFNEIMDYCNGDNTQIDVDWEPELELPELADISGNNISINKTFSTAYIPNKPVTSLWQLGAVHRGEPGRTVNLKEYGDAANKFKYAGGDAWILDYFRLNQLDETATVRGRFNPNCFDAAAYDSLLSYLPYIDDVNETSIYDPLKDGCDDNIGDQYAEAQAAQTVKLADFITYDSGAVVDNKQSWSPVEAFTNFVKLSSAANVKLNDRVAESFIGCTAGLLSTRYETFTIIAAGQKVNYLMDDAEMTAVKDNAEYMRSLVNPIQIGEMGTDWYSVMGTRLQLVTVVRDCWFNTYTVVSRQKL